MLKNKEQDGKSDNEKERRKEKDVGTVFISVILRGERGEPLTIATKTFSTVVVLYIQNVLRNVLKVLRNPSGGKY